MRSAVTARRIATIAPGCWSSSISETSAPATATQANARNFDGQRSRSLRGSFNRAARQSAVRIEDHRSGDDGACQRSRPPRRCPQPKALPFNTRILQRAVRTLRPPRQAPVSARSDFANRKQRLEAPPCNLSSYRLSAACARFSTVAASCGSSGTRTYRQARWAVQPKGRAAAGGPFAPSPRSRGRRSVRAAGEGASSVALRM